MFVFVNWLTPGLDFPERYKRHRIYVKKPQKHPPPPKKKKKEAKNKKQNKTKQTAKQQQQGRQIGLLYV